jgi:hypothetical protein
MYQSRGADWFRTVRVISQRAIALGVLVSGCVCEDALMTYSAPADTGTPEPVPTSVPTPVTDPLPSTSFAPYDMPSEWTSSLATAQPARLEVVPADVSTLVGLDFEMRVRMYDASGTMIPVLDEGEIEWSIAPTNNVTITPAAPGRVLVNVSSLGTPYTLSALHSISGLSDKVAINPVKLEAPNTEDWIAGTHDAREPPMISLVDGAWSTFDDDRLFAFVGGASLGIVQPGCSTVQTGNCGEATIFATRQSLNRQSFAWLAGCNLIDRRNTGAASLCTKVGSGPSVNAVPIPLKIWVFATTATDGLVTADLGFMKNALRDAWSGASIAERIEQTGDTRTITLDFASDGVTCAPSVFTRLIDEFQITGLAPDKATVVVVQQLFRRALDGSSELYWSGYACPYDAAHGAVTFVDWHRKQLTTTSHEVGHILGPWDSNDNWGHTEAVGAPASNLMLGLQKNVDFPRWSLTLGQAYRYSLDKHAIINRTLGTALARCPLITTPGMPCPSITKDVR